MTDKAPERRTAPIYGRWLAYAGGLMMLFLLLPLAALLLRTMQSDGLHTLGSTTATVRTALLLSLATTGASMVLVVGFGTPLAFALARHQFRGKRVLSIFVELPIVMPPVVAGLALLMAFGRRGLLGAPLADLGIYLAFTPAAVILAQTFVSAPFFIRAAQIRFEAIPRELEEAAAIDGASGWQLFWEVIIPLSWRGLFVGLLLSWARALGEFGATILFAGNLVGRTQTMPLLVYSALERDLDSTLWTSIALLALAIPALALVQLLSRRWQSEDSTLLY
ncbi:MAG: ABC transporter permease [Anaerolineales bacterium]